MWLTLSPVSPMVPKNSMAPIMTTKMRMETVTGKGKDPYLPVGHEHGAREQNSVNGAGCANRGRKRISPTAHGQQTLHDYGDDARANSAQEEIGVEAARAPSVFQVRAKHGQEQQIQQHMENARVQKI